MVAKAIATYLAEMGIEPAQLAAASGLGKDTIQSGLEGEHNFSIEEYDAICSGLGVSHQFFFDRRKAM